MGRGVCNLGIMLIHTEDNTNHYESTYEENNNMFSNRESIDTTVQSPELQFFLKVDFSLRWEKLTYQNRLSRHTEFKNVDFIV